MEASFERLLKHYCLIVDGRYLGVILNDQYLKSHFAFLCCICENIVGYNLSHTGKARIVQLIRGSASVSPTILAVGGSAWHDSWMMESASCSVEVFKQEKESSRNNAQSQSTTS
jgi:phospholipid-translocating ATPase